MGGCSKSAPMNSQDSKQDSKIHEQNTENSTDNEAASISETSPLDPSEYFSNRDFEIGYDESDCAVISLNGDSASCNSNAVQISGSTITITDEGTYLLSGTLSDGMVIINTEKNDKTQLILNNAAIHSETCAPLYVLQSDKVFITTVADTVNTLSNGGTFIAIDDNNIDAVIFSKEDVTLNGAGTLVLTSPAGHGIVSKDSLTVTSGSYDISCASHGLSGKDDISLANATFAIVSGKDGIHAENDEDATLGMVYIQSGTYSITAQGDGISAGAAIQIDDGTFQIESGGGSENAARQISQDWGNFMGGGRHGGMMPDNRGKGKDISQTTDSTQIADSTSIKGIKAGSSLLIQGGTFTIDSADDSIHSNGSVTVNGGHFTIASGDDAFHGEDTLTINDGTILISESYEGLEALHILVSGGEITLTASDDGLNAAGGIDQSGMGGRDAMSMGGKRPDGMGGKMPGGMPGGMGNPGNPFSSNSDGSIRILDGSLHITASGDGIDANGYLEITGGVTTVCGPTKGDTATLDYDTTATISGGTFIGTGASGMAQTFNDSAQGVVAVSVGNQKAGTPILLTDSSGKELLSYEPELSFAVVILSSPEIVKGQTYTITVGESSGAFEAY